MTLKLKVSDLESELEDERRLKSTSAELTVGALKSQVQEQYLD